MNTHFTHSATRIATFVLSAIFAVGFVAAPVASAASLTPSQIQAVTNLLVAFGVDSSTITNVQAALNGTSTTSTATSTSTPSSLVTANMIGYLHLGARGQEVKYLQALLAANPNIYPAALVTGYYGPLTAEAVKRFQAEHGLEQVGFIGPKTLDDLRGDLEDHPIAMTSNASSTSNGLCAAVPSGHFIAPGWLKHHEGEDHPILSSCGTIPPGIAWKIGLGSTSTPPYGGPSISSLQVSSVTNSGATITWTSNEKTTGMVSVGTTTAYSNTFTQGSELTTSHTVTVTGLTASTTYHFKVTSTDAANRTVHSTDMTFTTTAAPDTTPPVISAVSVGSLASTSAQISWTTNEAATSKIYYGTTTPLDLSAALPVASTSLTTSHALSLSSLATSTAYYYVVTSADASGNTATSTSASFTTLAN